MLARLPPRPNPSWLNPHPLSNCRPISPRPETAKLWLMHEILQDGEQAVCVVEHW